MIYMQRWKNVICARSQFVGTVLLLRLPWTTSRLGRRSPTRSSKNKNSSYFLFGVILIFLDHGPWIQLLRIHAGSGSATLFLIVSRRNFPLISFAIFLFFYIFLFFIFHFFVAGLWCYRLPYFLHKNKGGRSVSDRVHLTSFQMVLIQ